MKTGKITAKLRDAVPVCLMVAGEEVKRYKNIELPDLIKELEMTDFHFNIHADGKITFEIHYADDVLPAVFPAARAKMTRAGKTAMKAKEQAAALPYTETTSIEPSKAATPAASEEATKELPAVIVKPIEFFKPEESTETPETVEITNAKDADTGKEHDDIAAENKASSEEAADISEEAAATSEKTSDNADEQSAESGSMEIAYNITGPRRKELALAVGDFIGAAPKYMKAPTYAFAVANYTIDRNGTLIGAENKALVEALTEKGFIAA